jgi:uncharacterized membrane protein
LKRRQLLAPFLFCAIFVPNLNGDFFKMRQARRISGITAVCLGIGMYLGLQLQSLWYCFLLLILVLAGFHFMFKGRFPGQLLESLVILIFGPLFVLYMFGIAANCGTYIFRQVGVVVDPGVIVGILIIIFLAASVYIGVNHFRNREIDRFELQGAEREPVIPDHLGEGEQEENINDDDFV